MVEGLFAYIFFVDLFLFSMLLSSKFSPFEVLGPFKGPDTWRKSGHRISGRGEQINNALPLPANFSEIGLCAVIYSLTCGKISTSSGVCTPKKKPQRAKGGSYQALDE